MKVKWNIRSELMVIFMQIREKYNYDIGYTTFPQIMTVSLGFMRIYG